MERIRLSHSTYHPNCAITVGEDKVIGIPARVVSAETEHTGGNFYSDIYKLENGAIIIVTCDAIYFYNSQDDRANDVFFSVIF